MSHEVYTPNIWAPVIAKRIELDNMFIRLWESCRCSYPEPSILELCKSAKEDTRRKILFAIKQKKKEMAERIVGYPIQEEDY